jgi:DNA-binding transcriptional LysR family regulator
MAAMLLMTPEEAEVFNQLDPASACRLIVGRTGRAFVWDPINSTTEVPFKAAQSLVAAGIVGANGKIALEHVALWNQLRNGPLAARRAPRPAPQPTTQVIRAERMPQPPLNRAFEQTLPLGHSADSLRAMN